LGTREPYSTRNNKSLPPAVEGEGWRIYKREWGGGGEGNSALGRKKSTKKGGRKEIRIAHG